MKFDDVEIVVGVMRKLTTARDDLREVRFDPDAELCEADKENLLDAEQQIDAALLALHGIEVD